MVRVIMGVKGTGKTKQMIELINAAAKSEAGSVVCIEHGSKLTYDIHYQFFSLTTVPARKCPDSGNLSSHS